MHLSLHLATQRWPVLGSNRYGACASLLVAHLHCYIIPAIRQYPKVVGGPGVKPGFVASDATVLFLTLPTLWNSRRESNPDLFVRTEASSCFRPREPNLGWQGCRELNSDLKVRSLAPSSVGPHSYVGSGREI